MPRNPKLIIKIISRLCYIIRLQSLPSTEFSRYRKYVRLGQQRLFKSVYSKDEAVDLNSRLKTNRRPRRRSEGTEGSVLPNRHRSAWSYSLLQ
jgi:hypothetical protein